MSKNIIIIGAGLSGLNLAYQLQKQGIKSTILESRNRLGGRINTVNNKDLTLELGATWFADKHMHLSKLLDELRLDKVEQDYGRFAIYEYPDGKAQLYELPEQQEASYRIKGGTSVLIEALFKSLNTEQIHLNTRVQSLDFTQSEIIVATDQGQFKADAVINTLPPNLFLNQIKTNPFLPQEQKNLFAATHTWMGESIKVGLLSPTKFWHEREVGTIYSQRGPITEMYDHSNDHGFALKGFLHDQFNNYSREAREHAVRSQLSKFFGKESIEKCKYVEQTWRSESDTFYTYEKDIFPHQNNGHQLLRKPLFDGKLYMAGSETASKFPGYLDGAIEASSEVMNELISN